MPDFEVSIDADLSWTEIIQQGIYDYDSQEFRGQAG
jgi:hypothetical protein